jgi:hypothetical protein
VDTSTDDAAELGAAGAEKMFAGTKDEGSGAESGAVGDADETVTRPVGFAGDARRSGRDRGRGTTLAAAFGAPIFACPLAALLLVLCAAFWAGFAKASTAGTSKVPDRRRPASQVVLVGFIQR